jgi:hypothetical protein
MTLYRNHILILQYSCGCQRYYSIAHRCALRQITQLLPMRCHECGREGEVN